MLPAFYLPTADLGRGALIALGLGVVAGIMPGMQAMRLRIVDALRRT
jgi:ABC-type antimicrobial peptide transport system permease subunit